MVLKKVLYSSLNARQKEIFNFQKVAGRLADYGYNCIKLADDWQGAEFLAYRVGGNDTLKVQLKPRATVATLWLDSGLKHNICNSSDRFLFFPLLSSVETSQLIW